MDANAVHVDNVTGGLTTTAPKAKDDSEVDEITEALLKKLKDKKLICQAQG